MTFGSGWAWRVGWKGGADSVRFPDFFQSVAEAVGLADEAGFEGFDAFEGGDGIAPGEAEAEIGVGIGREHVSGSAS